MERLYTANGWCILANKQELAKATGIFKVKKHHPKAAFHNREPAEIAIQNGEHWVNENDAESMQTLAYTVGLTKIFPDNHKTQHEVLKTKPSGFNENLPLSAENCQMFGEGGESVDTVKLARVAALYHQAVTSTLSFGVIMQPDRNGVSDMYGIPQNSVFFLPQFMFFGNVKSAHRIEICTQLVKDYAVVDLGTSFKLGKVDLYPFPESHGSSQVRAFRAWLKIHLNEAVISRDAADGNGEPSNRTLESLKEFLSRNSDPEKFRYPNSETIHMFLAKLPFDEEMAKQLIKEISTTWPDLNLALDSDDMLDISKQLRGYRAYDVPWPHFRCFLAVCSQIKSRYGTILVGQALKDTQQCCGNVVPPPSTSGNDATDPGIISAIVQYIDGLITWMEEFSRVLQRPVPLDETLPILPTEDTFRRILNRAASTPDVQGVRHSHYEVGVVLMNRLMALERSTSTHIGVLILSLREMRSKLSEGFARNVNGEGAMQ